jgi:DNA-binding MarR family transcriptional regulator
MVDKNKTKNLTNIIVSVIPFGFFKLFHNNDKRLELSPTKSQYQILFFLCHHGTMSTTEICNRLNISKPNMTVLVDKLLKEGKVSRTPDIKDRRVINISITKNGSQFIKKQITIVKSIINKNLSQLDEKDIDILEKSLINVKNVFEKTDNKNYNSGNR